MPDSTPERLLKGWLRRRAPRVYSKILRVREGMFDWGSHVMPGPVTAWRLLWKAYYRCRFRMAHSPGSYRPRIGMHTVFIARENILFMEEWILHHRSLGVEHFFLYDNSAVEVTRGSRRNRRRPSEVSNHHVPFGRIVTMTDRDIQDELDRLQHEIPNVFVYQWSPLGHDGRVHYQQVECQTMAIDRHGDMVDWMLFMDVDEYLVLGGEDDAKLPELCGQMAVGGDVGAEFWGVQMDDRYNHMEKSVCEISVACGQHHSWARFGKVLCYLPRVNAVWIHGFRPFHPRLQLPRERVHYRHYRCRHARGSNLTVAPLSPPAMTHGSEWKLGWVIPDWEMVMEATTGPDGHAEAERIMGL